MLNKYRLKSIITLLALTSAIPGVLLAHNAIQASSGDTMNAMTVTNSTSAPLYYSYEQADKTVKTGSIAPGATTSVFQGAIGLASPTYLAMGASADDLTDYTKEYCTRNGEDFYQPANKPKGQYAEYPTPTHTGWVAYNPSTDQPFVKTHQGDPTTGHVGYSNMIIPIGAINAKSNINVLGKNKCVYDVDPVAAQLIEDSHSGAVNETNVTVNVHYGDTKTIDMANMFADKVPAGTDENKNPTSQNIADMKGLIVQANPSLPDGYKLVAGPHSTYTDWQLTIPKTLQPTEQGKPYQVKFAACDTYLDAKNAMDKNGDLFPGVFGLCGPGNNPNEAPSGDTDTLSAQGTMSINVLRGVFDKDPDQIVADFEKAGEDKTKQPLLTVNFNNQTNGAYTIANVDKYFTASSDVGSNVQYSIVTNDTPVTNRNDGNQPWTSKISAAADADNSGKNWGPILLQNGAPGIALDPADFKANGNSFTLAADSNSFKTIQNAMNAKGVGGAVVQLTIQNHYTGTDTVSNPNAFQTIYLVFRNSTTEGKTYTILQHHVQAWLYAPNDMAAGPDATTQTPLFKNDDKGDFRVSGAHSSCNYTAALDTVGRLKHFVSSITDSWPASGDATNGKQYGISEITPDMGWLDIDEGWGSTDNPQITDLYADPTQPSPEVGCLASFFKYNAAKAGHPLKFLVTEEYGKALANAAQNDMQPWQLQLVLKDLLIDANPIAWNSATNAKQAYYSDGSKNFRLVDGIQFDLEAPFPNDEAAHKMYKGVADLLAREGKTNEIYAFADADNPALMQAQVTMGKFLLSSYDVESNTPASPTNTPAHADSSSAAFWGNGTTGGDPDKYGEGEYSYKGVPFVDPTTANAQDFACHFNGKGPDQLYISNSWCSANLSDLVFGNVIRFNSTAQGTKDLDFEKANEMFSGHFMVSVPAEASATSWAYNLIFKPRAVPDSLDNGNHYVVPMVPNTYKAVYVPLTYTAGAPLAGGGKGTLLQAIQQYVATNGYPATGTYDVFYNSASAANASVEKDGCSWAMSQDSAKVASCDAILVSHNNGAVDGDFNLTSGDPEGSLTSNNTDKIDHGSTFSTDYDDLHMLVPSNANGDQYTANELQVIYDQANSKPDSSKLGADKISYVLKTPLYTPQNNPLHNMGVAMFALADISGENKYMPGLMNEGTVGTLDDSSANKSIQFPVSFDGRAEQTTKRNMWTITDDYMNGKTGTIHGGVQPPNPPPPGSSVSITPVYVDDLDEGFKVQGMASGETCSIVATAPDGSTKSASVALHNGDDNKVAVADPIQFAIANSDEGYTFQVTCSNTKDSQGGAFNHYGDKLYVCIDGANTADTCKVVDSTTTGSIDMGSFPYGKHTITTYPQDINVDNSQMVYQPDLGNTIASVDIEQAQVHQALTYISQIIQKLRSIL